MAGNKEAADERVLLKKYLGQYYSARRRKRQLEIRLQTFRQEMVGTRGMQYSPVPHSQTNSVGDGPASMVIRAMEIEDQIKTQKEEMANAMLNVMKMMDFLPADSMERTVLEYRHIDCLSWKQVCEEVHLSRSTANDYYDKGIDRLLTFKKVHKMLEDFEKLYTS